MAKVDFKVTVWESIEIPDEIVEQVKEGIKNNTITCSSDLYELEDSFLFDSEVLLETADQMSRKENGDQPTIELIVDNEILVTN